MKILKRIGIILFIMLGLFVVVTIWYKMNYSMDIAKSREINSPSLEQKILIATQGSEFKNEITFRITEYYETKSVYIKTIDVSLLDGIQPTAYDAIIILHTWENLQPPIAVTEFVEQAKTHKDKMVILTTSGEGSIKMENVDALTGESIQKNAEDFSSQIIEKVNLLLTEQ